MTGLVALTSGSAAEAATFSEPRFRRHLDEVVYSGGTSPVLDSAAAVWVPEGTPMRRLSRLAPQLEALLARGGTVLMFGEQQGGWPSSLSWRFRAVGGARETQICGSWTGTTVGAAAHELHHHGVLDAPEDAEVVLAASDGSAVAYLHRPHSGGTLFVSTFDPLAHFGHTTDPVCGHFLTVFLPWVRANLVPQ